MERTFEQLACFESEDWREWSKFADAARNVRYGGQSYHPCEDCTSEYASKMRAKGLCEFPEKIFEEDVPHAVEYEEDGRGWVPVLRDREKYQTRECSVQTRPIRVLRHFMYPHQQSNRGPNHIVAKHQRKGEEDN